jgi:hypothetical protein
MLQPLPGPAKGKMRKVAILHRIGKEYIPIYSIVTYTKGELIHHQGTGI